MNQQQAVSQEGEKTLVQYKIQRLEGSMVEFTVVASQELVLDARRHAIKHVGKEKVIAGFRKGKAPDEIIIRNYPADVDKAWQEQIVGFSLTECMKLSHIHPLHKDTKIHYHIISHSLHEDAHLTLKFEVEPEIPPVTVENFKLKKVEKPVVNADKIDETVRQTQYFFAEWENVHDRAVIDGDCVVLDVDITETTPAQSLFTATRFEVSKKRMAKWMYDLVLGMKPTEQKEGISTVDEDAPSEEKELFQPKKVRLSVRSIQKAKLPELTDEFAAKLGVTSVAEMRKNIEEILHRQAEAHVKEKEREQISAFLLKEFAFDLPLSMIEREAVFRMRQLLQDSHFRAYWQSLNEEEQKKSISTLFEQSKRAIQMFYLCRKILADNKIQVSPNQIQKAPLTPMEVFMNPSHSASKGQSTDIENAEAYSRLILEKAEDFLLEQAKKDHAK